MEIEAHMNEVPPLPLLLLLFLLAPKKKKA